MPTRMGARLAAIAAVASLAGLFPGTPAAAGVPGTGCSVFPASNIWNTDVSGLPVNVNSAAWLASTGGATRNLHPDFGPSGDPNLPYGIPFKVVGPSHARVNVSFQYAGESDRGPYPFGPDVPIEGGANSSGDRHALMIDSGSCTLYELYDAHYLSSGSTAGSGAVFNLGGNELRPSGWTSADAAGLPIFPGLLRLDEVNNGFVNHAIRFTVQRTAASFIWPARHQAGSGPAAVKPPMGARFRMKAGVDITRFSPKAQVILRAFQHYGLIVADNGSNWYFQGDANNAWPDSLIAELKAIPAADFEAIDESTLMVDPNSGQARQATGRGAPPPTAPLPIRRPAVVAPPVGGRAVATLPGGGAPVAALPVGSAPVAVAAAAASPAAADGAGGHAGTVAQTAARVLPAPVPGERLRWYWLAIVPVALSVVLVALGLRRRGG